MKSKTNLATVKPDDVYAFEVETLVRAPVKPVVAADRDAEAVMKKYRDALKKAFELTNNT